MAAYMIVTCKIENRDEFLNGYGQAAAKMVAKYGGKYVLMGSNAELLEGNFHEKASMVISEWPDKEAAKRFFHSEEYNEIKKLREKISNCLVYLIEAPKIN